MNEQILWIWLSLACTPGTENFSKLISEFKTVDAIYALDEYDLKRVIGSKTSDFSVLLDKDTKKAEKVFEYCVRKNIGILKYSDAEYPESLRSISNPPVLLYYRGILPDFESLFCVSVVGTRRLSEYGLKNAFTISRDLASAGATVVSGMALGVDGVAHAGALSGGGITIAVLGSGIDVCYPADHKLLAREIVKNGCVFTEYAPGTKPEKYNFPRRNRIISGLSKATLVIEGRERSGALITARHAESQGRGLYALPGNVGNTNSELTNLLIKNGAKLCSCADDIVRDFEQGSLGRLNPFLLGSLEPVDILSELRKYSVSAVTPNDPVFKRKRKASENKETKKEKVEAASEKHSADSKAPVLDGFDKETLEIYKRIPQGEECSIESLVDSELSLRKVMRGLLRLEMGRFVVMLPGEKVKRSF